MRSPLFQPGDQVIIQSIHSPELNGQVTTVLEVLHPEQATVRTRLHALRQGVYWTGKYIPISPYYCVLDGVMFHPRDVENRRKADFKTDVIAESALRKLHRPAGQSFNHLMQSLNSTKVIQQ